MQCRSTGTSPKAGRRALPARPHPGPDLGGRERPGPRTRLWHSAVPAAGLGRLAAGRAL